MKRISKASKEEGGEEKKEEEEEDKVYPHIWRQNRNRMCFLSQFICLWYDHHHHCCYYYYCYFTIVSLWTFCQQFLPIRLNHHFGDNTWKFLWGGKKGQSGFQCVCIHPQIRFLLWRLSGSIISFFSSVVRASVCVCACVPVETNDDDVVVAASGECINM